jgi:hypothetical protein
MKGREVEVINYGKQDVCLVIMRQMTLYYWNWNQCAHTAASISLSHAASFD